MEGTHRVGYVAIVGAPNVGKSTLLNTLVGLKIAIATPKPQTTRRRLLGIRTVSDAQLLFLDTPGIHRARDLMNRRMVASATQSLDEGDVTLMVVDATRPHPATDVEAAVKKRNSPLVVAVNKIDLVGRDQLLPILSGFSARFPQAELTPVSARDGDNVDRLLAILASKLPEGPPMFGEDEVTDVSERFIVSELIREQVMIETRDEVPYSTAVTIDTFEEKTDRDVTVIQATIHVNRDSQKPIVIGRAGQRIKAIGQKAREEIEVFLGRRVFLELFVRVQLGWVERASHLQEFGI